MEDPHARRQKLSISHLIAEQEDGRTGAGEISILDRVVRESKGMFRESPLRYNMMLVIGWIFWKCLVVVCFIAGLYIAASYLILMPVTGILIRQLHGGKPRKLLRRKVESYDRLIVATSSLNGSSWWAYYGKNTVVKIFSICRYSESSAIGLQGFC
jgi:hypothetical protein